MRYFLTLAYRGTHYVGWQHQPNGLSVQEVLEKKLGTLLREPVVLTGCGRTDSGVHARHYVAHFDAEKPLPPHFLDGANSLLPDDIAVQACIPVAADAHARFDAVERSYIYTITLQKDPFLTETAWFYPQGTRMATEGMHQVAAVLPQYDAFLPFCKSGSGVDHFRCRLTRCRWEVNGAQLQFHISANRFLRGMVRLIVGASVQVALGKLTLDAVVKAMDTQTPLPKSQSVPPQGLALTAVSYPYPSD